ncbi:YybH family protein [Pseudonocardia spinosispora]|uniref:YybH family protein n=1 Tax=Pseudonocardia spinosispora TaxID=103441 RepID=UPI00048C394D|nr:nuclear transport factor 2 family protein [Pseudonocardia spinosispora]
MVENSSRADEFASDEDRIRALLDTRVEALRVKNIDEVMSLNLSDIVVFDIPAPLQYLGNEAYRKSIVSWLESYQGPIAFETRDLNITIGGDVGFAHHLFRVSGILHSGIQTDHWVRLTYCFRKINEEWWIAHEHISLPIDLDTSKAIHDIQP